MSGDPAPADRLRAAVAEVDAPDVVFAHSRSGDRTVVTGGTAPCPAVPREELRYEIGSVTKTFTGLLLAALAERGDLRLSDRAVAHLPGRSGAPRIGRGRGRHRRTAHPYAAAHPRPYALPPAPAPSPAHPHRDAITLLHLMAHTSGLPALPWDFYPQGLPRWGTNPYAGYSTARLLDAFARSRPRHAPGSRWRYSNFGVALLGTALSRATGTPFAELMAERVLAPLGLRNTALAPAGPGTDATGRRKDGLTELPPFEIGAFTAAGGVRAAPGDLLRFLEAQLRPQDTPLHAELTAVQLPLLRRGLGHRHTHTLTWFQHPTDSGPVYFHAGATMGQEIFLGFRPGTGTALVAIATRRHTHSSVLARRAYELLTGPA
ncbi:class A beta-lactamase-related serine hydrolase [Streptomyces armeniacus]|uniref:Class A beta-lactamase-related serine hydrolase n=1 Tax=Streptomyces armeniacus TaxID=83291 RepID=A0A345Y0I9_9ACTN|nr:serine hydrolase domain-containing protein [Streptomyces armeniacus]AXK37405.1 class A beta-lactamase-related serine hydrolase [Streptomyces armeniacus]